MTTVDVPEGKTNLASLAMAPVVWATHFLLSYATAAIWCAKRTDALGSLGGARAVIAIYTIVALGIIVAIAVRAWRAYRLADAPEDRDLPQSRHRFVAVTTLLLAGLSAIAIVYAALATALAGSCR